MKKMFYILALITLTGCATIFSGTTQDVNVKVVDINNNNLISNVKCQVTDSKKNTYLVLTNPDIIKVKKGNGPLSFQCTKSDYKQIDIGASGEFNPITIVNVLFWPGLLVDAASGAYEQYPSTIIVRMQKN